jgi:branched-chain amino acid transport system substrate-binding protein
MLFLARWAAVVCCSLAIVQAASAEKRVALVIGNASYGHHPRLPNVPNDAAAIAALFKAAKFDVVDARSNLGVADLRRALREFSGRTADADIAVLFYAGHGMEVGQTNYLVPVDARLATDYDVEDEAISLDRVLQAMEPARRLRLVILDACRDNPFVNSMKRTVAARSIGRGLGRVEPQSTNTLIAFATKPNAIADDGKGPNSPFTAALLKHLLKPGLDLRIALGHVRDDVLLATGNRQAPYVTGSLGGGTLSIAGPAPVASPSPVAPPPVVQPAPSEAAETARVCREVGGISSLAMLQVLERQHKGRPAGECIAARIAELQKVALAVPPAPPPAPVAPLAPKPASPSGAVRVGIAGPLTGFATVFGAQVKNGAKQAIDDINTAGGILGHRIVASFGDDRSNTADGVSVAKKFVEDGVKFVVGHFGSGVSLPASEIYQENGILMITPAATNPRLTERRMWNVFRTCARDDRQALVAADYIARHFLGKRIAIVHDKTVYGKGLADGTRLAMLSRGIREVLYEGVNNGDKDFTALVGKLRAARPDLVYWGGLYDAGGLIARQMRDRGLKAPLMGGDGMVSDEFAVIAGPGAEGTLMTFAPDPRKRPVANAVVAKFRARNFEPEAFTLYSYAAVEVLKQAAERANSLDPRSVAAEIGSGRTFRTVLGDLSYDKKGDITRLDYVMYTWRKGPDGKISYFEN